MNMIDFLIKSIEMENAEKPHQSLDILFKGFYDLMMSEKWADIDDILCSLDVSNLSVNIFIGILSITLPVAKYLKCRKTFYTKVKKELIKRNRVDFKTLLQGLWVK